MVITRRKFITAASGLFVPVTLQAQMVLRSAPFSALLNTRYATGGGGGGCSVASGDIFNRCFETGESTTGWTTLNSADTAYDITGTTPPSQIGSLALRANAAGTAPYIEYDTGSETSSTRYLRFYFRLTSDVPANDASILLARGDNAARTKAFSIYFFHYSGGGGYYIRSDDGSGHLNQLLIGTSFAGLWFRVELKYVPNATATVLRVYNSSGTQIGTDQTQTTANVATRYWMFGAISSQTADTQIDGIGVDSTGYLGQ